MRRTLARLSARIAPDAPSAASSSTPSFARPDTPATRPPRAQYGQALPHSHPHLFPRTLPFPAPPPLSLSLSGASAPAQADVAHEQLTPGIPAAEYAERRSRLMQSLPEGSAVLVMAARIKCMSGNINYRFRQDSNFWYLTGWQEPDAALLLESAPSSAKGYKMTMFVSPRDSVSELWNGPRNGIDGAMDVFGADQAFAMDPVALQAYLKTLLSSTSHFYLDLPSSPSFPRRSRSSSSSSTSSGNLLTYLTPSASSLDVFSKKSDFDALVKLLNDSKRTRALAPFVEKLRLVKSRHELGVMRKAGAIGSKGMREVMRFAEVGRSEGQVQATFEHLTSLHGAQRPAYVPVVASGLNALTIHYIANESLLHANDLVCIDAGPEVDGYVSDITRVFPVSSRFSSAQKDLYSAVLRVLKQCTSLATAQNGYTQGELHRRSVELLRVELERLGFNLRSGMLERLYPHSLSHWLGIDLHDTPTIERGTRLQEGHVLTIEPAVYVPQGDDAFPKAFWGMGIRIEDDVAVGYDSNVVLSAEAPREVEDVEAACAGWEEGVEIVKREVSEQMRRTQ